MEIQSHADKQLLKRELNLRLTEYQRSLSQIGLTSQQYDVLRGRIAEINDLIECFQLNQTE
ncbi:hypothetical protein QV08_01280 [Gallibacterium salpingitidis]|uniref:50S ribosomal protein L29 n=1 Tax=Gallibacterium salpingitidis TaxID=505341 RepID=A0AB36E2Q8_9PAST|nr:hypothetical protein [Gallibacterium salpingitidis]OBX09597.1 hypothetical protein QV08_01280 [Gallibacterium salpingitidis]OBX10452.1 hypothetical protein QV09_05835 [Gallibacterium salpingitidis]